MRNFIVVVDPKGDYPCGSVVNDQVRRVLEMTEGTLVLPVWLPAFDRHALAGWQERSWGQGIVPHECRHERVARHALFLVNEPSAKVLHWVARLQATFTKDMVRNPTSGHLRLAADVTANINSGGVGIGSSVDLGKLGEPDADGGWLISGYASVACMGDGMCSLQLYGCGTGVKLVWSAVSQGD